ncbi:MAG: gliding motility-associated C-terminal domain-containing protein [Flavipsychrobacter sp.]
MKIKCIIFLLLLQASAIAQKQNNTWVLGRLGGLNFNTTTPTTFKSTMYAWEGISCVSHRKTGELLFACNGVDITDSSSNVMPNGKDVGTDRLSTCAQGSVIIPDPSDSNKYYVFTLQHIGQNGDVRYSIVDMRLNGGKGDVISSKKSILLTTNMTEIMTVSLACDGYWLILFERVSNKYHCYKIGANGISNSPIISTMSYPYKINGPSTAKVSSDGTKIASVVSKSGGTSMQVLILNDFDIQTGIVSNTRLLDTSYSRFGYQTGFYNCEFSPNSTKLYAASDTDGYIYQYDVSLSTGSNIRSSKKEIYSISHADLLGSFQLGPDSNIYISFFDNYLGRIDNPDIAFPGCIVTKQSLKLPTGSIGAFALPQKVLYNIDVLPQQFTGNSFTICKGDSLIFHGRKNAATFVWSTGSTDSSIKITKAGTYWVQSKVLGECTIMADTFYVNVPNIDFELGNDTVICLGESLTISPNLSSQGVSYLWQDNSTSSSQVITTGGKYYLTILKDGCTNTDTINIDVKEEHIFNLGNDTTICVGDTMELKIQGGLDEYAWNNGTTTNSIVIKKSGIYSLRTNHEKCSHTDTIKIDYTNPKFELGNDTLLCEGNYIKLNVKSLSGSFYTWSTGSNNETISINSSGLYWAIAENICGTTRDSIYINYQICDCTPFIPSAFTPNNDGRNDKLKPIIPKCTIAKYQFIIVNRYGETVFKTNNPNDYWDGTYRNKPCDIGSYFYILKTMNNLNKVVITKGDIVLIR